MKSLDDIASLGRIIIVIKKYRCQTNDVRILTNNSELDVYLKQHLSIQDWIMWQRLQQRMFLSNPEMNNA